MTGLMMALILVATSLFKFPVPFSQGYVHMGDAMIFLAVMILGRKNGAAAAGFGSALGDVLGGFAFWAPWTLAIKFLMAYLMGTVIEAAHRRGISTGHRGVAAMEVLGMVLGGSVMVLGYFLAERVIYGNWVAAAAGIPWNIGQAAVGAVCACVVAEALIKTPAKKYLTA